MDNRFVPISPVSLPILPHYMILLLSHISMSSRSLPPVTILKIATFRFVNKLSKKQSIDVDKKLKQQSL